MRKVEVVDDLATIRLRVGIEELSGGIGDDSHAVVAMLWGTRSGRNINYRGWGVFESGYDATESAHEHNGHQKPPHVLGLSR